MADTKTTNLTALTGANTAPTDVVPIVDISDTTQGASGTLKKQTRQELQTYNAGTLTTDVKVLDLSATWNNAAVTFIGKTNNFTSTASAAGSLMERWQMGGTNSITFRKDGAITLTYAGGGGLDAVLVPYSGTGTYAGLGIGIAGNGEKRIAFDYTRLAGNSVLYMGWTASGTDASAALDTAFYRNAAGVVEINNGTAGTWRDLKVRQHYVDQTITAGGTTGAQTINKAAGTVNFAAAATSLVVTNNLVTANSLVLPVLRTNDGTARIASVVPAAGSFTIYLTAAATAETSCGFVVINQ